MRRRTTDQPSSGREVDLPLPPWEPGWAGCRRLGVDGRQRPWYWHANQQDQADYLTDPLGVVPARVVESPYLGAVRARVGPDVPGRAGCGFQWSAIGGSL